MENRLIKSESDLEPKQKRLLTQLLKISANDFYAKMRAERSLLLKGEHHCCHNEKEWQLYFAKELKLTQDHVRDSYIAGLNVPETGTLPAPTDNPVSVPAMLETQPPPEIEDKQAYMKWYRQYVGMICELKPFQIKECKAIWDGIHNGITAFMMVSGTGTGKTFMLAYIAKMMKETGWFDEHMVCASAPIMTVTKNNVVPQFEDIVRYQFGMKEDVYRVINYDALGNTKGTMLGITERIVIKNGEPHTEYVWPSLNIPGLVGHDEWHAEKNWDSRQSKIMRSLITQTTLWPVIHIFASATPMTRVADGLNFVLATGLGASELLAVVQGGMERKM